MAVIMKRFATYPSTAERQTLSDDVDTKYSKDFLRGQGVVDEVLRIGHVEGFAFWRGFGASPVLAVI